MVEVVVLHVQTDRAHHRQAEPEGLQDLLLQVVQEVLRDLHRQIELEVLVVLVIIEAVLLEDLHQPQDRDLAGLIEVQEQEVHLEALAVLEEDLEAVAVEDKHSYMLSYI